MKKSNLISIARGAGLVLSIGGTILASWVTKKENEKTLAKLVNEALKNKQ